MKCAYVDRDCSEECIAWIKNQKKCLRMRAEYLYVKKESGRVHLLSKGEN